MQRLFTTGRINQHTDLATAVITLGKLGHDTIEQKLEWRDAGWIRTCLSCKRLKLWPMIIGQDAQFGPCDPVNRHSVQVSELRIRIRTHMTVAGKPIIELCLCWHRGCATMTRYNNRTTSVRQSGGRFKTLSSQQPRQQARGKRIASAQHIEHLNFFTQNGQRVIQTGRNRTVDDGAANRTALDHHHRVGQLSRLPKAGEQIVGHTTRNHPFFFGADNQFKVRQLLLQMLTDGIIGDIARLAITTPSQPPEHGPIINIEHSDKLMSLS